MVQDYRLRSADTFHTTPNLDRQDIFSLCDCYNLYARDTLDLKVKKTTAFVSCQLFLTYNGLLKGHLFIFGSITKTILPFDVL